MIIEIIPKRAKDISWLSDSEEIAQMWFDANDAYTFYWQGREDYDRYMKYQKKETYGTPEFETSTRIILKAADQMEKYWKILHGVSRELSKEKNIAQLKEQGQRDWIIGMVDYTKE